MKKILLGAIILTCFAIAITLTQISCQKTVAQTNGNNYVLPPATTSTLGGVIIGSGLSITNTGVLSVTPSSGGLQQQNLILFMKDNRNNDTHELWTANIDGTNQKAIPINYPAGLSFNEDEGARLTPDGKTVLFVMEDESNTQSYIYSCPITGGNATKIIDGGSGIDLELNGVY